jgi:hypothetical protein
MIFQSDTTLIWGLERAFWSIFPPPPRPLRKISRKNPVMLMAMNIQLQSKWFGASNYFDCLFFGGNTDGYSHSTVLGWQL